jgi:hypothetical protein
VMSNLEGVVETIRQTAADRARGLRLSPALPHKGGGSSDTTATATPSTGNIRGQP